MQKWIKDLFMYILAGLVVSYTFVFLYVLMFHKIPIENRDIVTTLSGVVVGGGFTSVIMYFFGTSKSSSDKNELLKKE